MRKIVLLLIVFVLVTPYPVFCAADPARIVSVRPEAFILKDAGRNQARIAGKVNRGDTLETGEAGRMSLLLPDRMLLKVASQTEFEYDPGTGDDTGGVLRKGRVWLRGHRQGGAFNIRTPTATTAIRGTEWYIEVADDGSTTIGVMDGQVEVSNAYGRVLLRSREVAEVRKGRPPVKAAYVVPDNAVNWTLNYLGFWDEPDFSRAGPDLATRIRGAVHAYDRNDLNPMLEFLAKTRPTYGDSAPWLALKGFSDLVSGRDKSAAAFFEKAAATDPGWALPLAHLALMHLVENDMVPARAFAAKALAVEPGSGVAHIAAAFVQKADLELELAFEAAQKAVTLSPGFGPALAVAARIALEMDDLDACRTLLEKLGPDSPVLSEKLTLQGFLALRTGNTQEALDAFTQASGLDPEASDALMGKGIALFNTNRTEEGFDAMIQATLMAPQVSAFQSYLAKAYLEEHSLDPAGQTLERAKRLDPKDPTPYLYESLSLFERHQPAQALLALEKARALNGNRAVFRSQYLLDQDHAVLMGNVAGLYNELGFSYSAVQGAARALETDPLNAAAYRRLFFSDVFQVPTRPLHQQAMESEKLLAKLLVPPTLNSMIFTPAGLQPYQPLFAVSGMDTVVSGNLLRRETRMTELDAASGYFGLVAKPDYPAAVALSVLPNVQDAESGFSSGNSTTTSDSDLETVNTIATAKYRISPMVTLFGELAAGTSEVDVTSLSSSGASIITDLGAYGSFFTDTDTATRSATLTDSDQYTLDGGAQIRISPTLSALVHGAWSRDRSDVGSDAVTTTTTSSGGTGIPFQTSQSSSTISSVTDTEEEYGILQATLWKKYQAHFFEAGLRYFSGEQRTDTDAVTVSGIDKACYSAFLSHQYTPRPGLTLNWGVNADHSRYETDTGVDDDNWFAGGHLGLVWQLLPEWTFRSALVRNRVGDGERRLQRPLNSGFSILSLSGDEVLGGNDAMAFHLAHETFSAAVDFASRAWPFFAGIEYARDFGDTFSYDANAANSRLDRESRSHIVTVYAETLLSRQVSLGASWSYADIRAEEPTLSYTGHRNRAAAGLSWFLPHGLSLKLAGVLEETDLAVSTRERYLAPELNWYALDNHMRITLKGQWGDTRENGRDDHLDEISLNVYWYY